MSSVEMPTVLTDEMLAETHPELPSTFRRTMGSIRNEGGPWPCSACDGVSYLVYRCSQCGHDLCGDSSTAGRQGGNR